MRGTAICFASPDGAFGKELGDYLRLHTSADVELAECSDSEAFLDVVEQCLTLEFVVVVLSAAAVPALWPRPVWEPILLEGARESGCQIAYAMRENCPFPLMLRRRGFFDFTADEASKRMELRQWLIRGLQPDRVAPQAAIGEKDERLVEVVDAPGLLKNVRRGGAQWLVSKYWRCFEGVYWVACGNWSHAGVLGEMAHALNLRLAGTVEQNWEALKRRAEDERSLFILEYLTDEFRGWAELGGKASVLILEHERAAEAMGEQRLKEMFLAPKTDEAACLRALGNFISSEQPLENWEDVKAIGFRARLYLQREERQAEAHELLVWMANHAQRHDDARALKQIQWEEAWILESWDVPPVERAELSRTQPSQMSLSLGA